MEALSTIKKLLLVLSLLLGACVPTPVPPPTVTTSPTVTATKVVPTETKVVPTETSTLTSTPEPCTQATPPPECWTAIPAFTDTPTPTRIPPVTSTPPNFVGLQNGSFEGAVYTRIDNTSSLFPLNWDFWWAEGLLGGSDVVYLKPEILPKHYLTMAEGRDLVPGGDWSLKLFKGWGPLWIIFGQRLELPPGSYTVGCAIYPDQVISYDNGKIYPSPESSTDWYMGSQVSMYTDLPGNIPPYKDAREVPYGKWTRVQYDFTLTNTRTVEVILDLKGPWGFTNNGWFVDDCRLTRQGSPLPTLTPVSVPASPWMAYHAVVSGDSLTKIAVKYGTTVSDIVAANAYRYPSLATNPSLLEVDWVLNVPCRSCEGTWGCCPTP